MNESVCNANLSFSFSSREQCSSPVCDDDCASEFHMLHGDDSK